MNTEELSELVSLIKFYINDYHDKLPYYAWVNAIILPILLFGFISDILTIVVFAKNFKKWSKHHVYLFVLAALELGAICAVAIPRLHYVTVGLFGGMPSVLDMTRNTVLCKILFALYFHAKAPSMILLLMIPIDRLWALHFPFSYRQRTLKTPVFISLIITVGISAALAVLNTKTQTIPGIIRIANETFVSNVCYTVGYFIFHNIVQSFIVDGMVTTVGLIIFNIWIVIKIKIIMSRSRAMATSNHEEAKRSRRQVAKSGILVAMSIMYMVCYTPGCIALLFMLYHSASKDVAALSYGNYAVVTYYGYANCLTFIPMAINILFYAKDVKFFSDFLLRLVPCRRREKQTVFSTAVTKSLELSEHRRGNKQE